MSPGIRDQRSPQSQTPWAGPLGVGNLVCHSAEEVTSSLEHWPPWRPTRSLTPIRGRGPSCLSSQFLGTAAAASNHTISLFVLVLFLASKKKKIFFFFFDGVFTFIKLLSQREAERSNRPRVTRTHQLLLLASRDCQ